MDRLYAPCPDSFAGDDDNGQISAWYFFSSLGFYPVCQGTDQYVLGTPLFAKVVLNLENGNRIMINAPKVSNQNRYINKLKFNGENRLQSWLSHEEMTKGCTIDFEMSPVPNVQKRIEKVDFPYSFSTN